MNEELKKWLEQNPPRVELTELEKTITIKDLVQQKYFVYFDDRSFDQIYRLKIFELSDANRCSEVELNALNNTYGQLYRSVNC